MTQKTKNKRPLVAVPRGKTTGISSFCILFTLPVELIEEIIDFAQSTTLSITCSYFWRFLGCRFFSPSKALTATSWQADFWEPAPRIHNLRLLNNLSFKVDEVAQWTAVIERLVEERIPLHSLSLEMRETENHSSVSGKEAKQAVNGSTTPSGWEKLGRSLQKMRSLTTLQISAQFEGHLDFFKTALNNKPNLLSLALILTWVCSSSVASESYHSSMEQATQATHEYELMNVVRGIQLRNFSLKVLGRRKLEDMVDKLVSPDAGVHSGHSRGRTATVAGLSGLSLETRFLVDSCATLHRLGTTEHLRMLRTLSLGFPQCEDVSNATIDNLITLLKGLKLLSSLSLNFTSTNLNDDQLGRLLQYLHDRSAPTPPTQTQTNCDQRQPDNQTVADTKAATQGTSESRLHNLSLCLTTTQVRDVGGVCKYLGVIIRQLQRLCLYLGHLELTDGGMGALAKALLSGGTRGGPTAQMSPKKKQSRSSPTKQKTSDNTQLPDGRLGEVVLSLNGNPELGMDGGRQLVTALARLRHLKSVVMYMYATGMKREPLQAFLRKSVRHVEVLGI